MSNVLTAVEWSLKAIEQYIKLNAVISYDAASALAQAREADAETGHKQKPAHGVTAFIKDNIATNGFAFTGGSPAFSNYYPDQESSAVTLLRDAGVVVVGKANLHEVAFGVTSANEHTGFVRNPFDPKRLAGGSSGGSAVAVATGMAQVSLATDTGGSARIPAALCGVFGWRPTTGRYPNDGVMTLSPTRDTLGLIGADVHQIAILDAVLAGVPSEPLSPPRKLKLGVVRQYFWEGLSESMAEACESALHKLANAGIELVDIDASDIGRIDAEISFPIAFWETSKTWNEYLERVHGLSLVDFLKTIASKDVRELFEFMSGPEMPSESDYLKALDGLAKIKEAYAGAFASGVDALVMPTTVRDAMYVHERELCELNGESRRTFSTFVRQTSPASLAGVPSISVPAGYLDNGMPFGLMLEAPRLDDRKLLSIALRVHSVCGACVASDFFQEKIEC